MGPPGSGRSLDPAISPEPSGKEVSWAQCEGAALSAPPWQVCLVRVKICWETPGVTGRLTPQFPYSSGGKRTIRSSSVGVLEPLQESPRYRPFTLEKG